MKAEVGNYSDREFFLDTPEAFVDFVIEAMRLELTDYGVDCEERNLCERNPVT
jgi:hypothetical protein